MILKVLLRGGSSRSSFSGTFQLYFSSCQQNELQRLRCQFVYSFLILEYEISLKGGDLYYAFMKIEHFKQNLIRGFF